MRSSFPQSQPNRPEGISMHKIISSDRSKLQRLVETLEDAWNAGDSSAFAAGFAEDADFVNVYGMHGRGRTAIADGHHFIFTTIYKESKVEYRVVSMRMLASDVALVHVSARLNVPVGPMAGTHEALWSGVATLCGDAWKFAAFHNTFVKDPPNPPSHSGLGNATHAPSTEQSRARRIEQPFDQSVTGAAAFEQQ
jgi:uncharacterized protein (TIGR02246 family)